MTHTGWECGVPGQTSARCLLGMGPSRGSGKSRKNGQRNVAYDEGAPIEPFLASYYCSIVKVLLLQNTLGWRMWMGPRTLNPHTHPEHPSWLVLRRTLRILLFNYPSDTPEDKTLATFIPFAISVFSFSFLPHLPSFPASKSIHRMCGPQI